VVCVSASDLELILAFCRTMGEISWGVGAMGMPGATACVFCNYLRSIFCEV
jgi:hypothetical protein